MAARARKTGSIIDSVVSCGWAPCLRMNRVFVREWEKRIFGVHAAMMGLSRSLRAAVPAYDIDAVLTAFASTWTWAHLRAAAEAMNPIAYFQYRYYEKWLGRITAYLREPGGSGRSNFRIAPGDPVSAGPVPSCA